MLINITFCKVVGNGTDTSNRSARDVEQYITWLHVGTSEFAVKNRCNSRDILDSEAIKVNVLTPQERNPVSW